jgi:hypothetical protein
MGKVGKGFYPALRYVAEGVECGTAMSILAVGEICSEPSAVQEDEDSVTYLNYGSLCGETLAQYAPELILAPLVSASFDCFDLAEKLVGAGYRGKLRVAVENLPNPTVVKREFSAQFPELDFDVIVLGRPELRAVLQD